MRWKIFIHFIVALKDPVSGRNLLLVMQRDHRVHFGGAASRDVAGQ